MKIIRFILFVVGIGLGAFGVYAYLFTADIENCQRSNSMAEEKLNEARAAMGTPREAALMAEVRMEVDSAERACRQATQTQQMALLTGLGGLVPIIVSVMLLVNSRRRRADQPDFFEPSAPDTPFERRAG